MDGTSSVPIPDSYRRWHRRLSEFWRICVAVPLAFLVFIPLLLLIAPPLPTHVDSSVMFIGGFLLVYAVLTTALFVRAPTDTIESWAKRAGRGTWLQRYLLGTAPGPGVSISFSAVALVAAVWWLPQDRVVGTTMSEGERLVIGVIVMATTWNCMVVSFTVSYYADNLLDEGRALDFPGPDRPEWSDYLYFSAAVSSTFGTTDVTVLSRAVRRTVTVHCVLAFVFNTVILGSVVGILA